MTYRNSVEETDYIEGRKRGEKEDATGQQDVNKGGFEATAVL